MNEDLRDLIKEMKRDNAGSEEAEAEALRYHKAVARGPARARDLFGARNVRIVLKSPKTGCAF